MDLFIIIGGIIVIIVLCTLLGSFFAWWLTEYKKPLIDKKPFNCRPCLTFWISMGFTTIAAVIMYFTAFKSYIYGGGKFFWFSLIVGIGLSLAAFFKVYKQIKIDK